jgi:hypothetical protein
MVSQSDKICINAVKVLLACTAIITNMTLIVITVKAKYG